TLALGGSNQDCIPSWGSRSFAISTQARCTTPTESSSGFSLAREISYGLAVHLLLLPTPCHHDAVAVGYKLRQLGEDFHLSDQVRFQAHVEAALRRHLAHPYYQMPA
ncbi:MAG: hypothetical protein ABSF71_30835, partial [Terriglobia bacterium]